MLGWFVNSGLRRPRLRYGAVAVSVGLSLQFIPNGAAASGESEGGTSSGATLVLGGLANSVPEASQPTTAATSDPITHVVVILQENHSFDNVLGKFCSEVVARQIIRPGGDHPCDGATQGLNSEGQTVPLAPAPDIVPKSTHNTEVQTIDIDGGKMDGFNLTKPCDTTPADCYNQYDPLSGPCSAGTCIPNLSALATKYVVSDRTFELYPSPSWGGHMVFGSPTVDGFAGVIPTRSKTGPQPVTAGPGWGCDSGATVAWTSPTGGSAVVPSCVADSTGSLGPNWTNYSGPRASYVPTIFDELDAANVTWKIYGGAGQPTDNYLYQQSGWQFTICPSFAECMYGPQHNNLVAESTLASDAAAGNLPGYSIVTPTADDSQHNSNSMSYGDGYLGQIVSSIQASSEWNSTAIFITYDDCGCFYDHVNPLQFGATWGIRVPMVIISPIVKPGYTDSNPTTFAGVMAFVEHVFNLPSINSADATAYNYTDAFCWSPATQHCERAGDASVPMIKEPAPVLTPAQIAAQNAAAHDAT